MAEKEQTEGVVVDVGKGRRPRLSKKQLLIALAGVGILAVVGLAALLFAPKDDGPDITKSTFNQSQDLKNEGDFGGAAKYASDRYDDVTGDDNKYMVAMQAATSYESDKKYQQAIEWYEKALSNKKNDAGVAAGIARSYQALGDKQKAAEYYQKAIDWYPTDGDKATRESNIALYQAELKKVQAQ